MAAVPSPVSREVARAIVTDLAALEARCGIRVLFACESGSRAWGFASPDSDYDVRFVYVRPRDWYLSIVPGRDVIEEPITDDMDVAGWDLRKALGLLRGGNATVLEWLRSPVIYRVEPGFAAALGDLADAAYRRDRSFHHYVALAVKDLALCQRDGDIRLKKFLYSLRCALAARWSATRDDAPPMRLVDLVDAAEPDATVRGLIADVVAAKSALGEGATYRVPPELLSYLQALVASLATFDVPAAPPAPVEAFDGLFRGWVTER